MKVIKLLERWVLQKDLFRKRIVLEAVADLRLYGRLTDTDLGRRKCNGWFWFLSLRIYQRHRAYRLSANVSIPASIKACSYVRCGKIILSALFWMYSRNSECLATLERHIQESALSKQDKFLLCYYTQLWISLTILWNIISC